MKKFLLSLFVGFVCLISFCSAEDDIILSGSKLSLKSTSETRSISSVYIDSDDFIYHVIDNGSSEFRIYNDLGEDILVCITNLDSLSFYGAYGLFNFNVNGGNGSEICYLMYGDLDWYAISYGNNFDISANIILKKSSIDTNYCVENELCPVNECIGSGTWSNVYINDILHPGEENIFIDIPDYIQWDYSVDTGNFNVYVGSGYDMDYMNSIIKINSYRPTSSDFTNIFVSGLTLIFPYIFVLLLIVFMWKLIKRVFK